MFVRYPTGTTYVGRVTQWRADHTYQQVPPFSSGQSRDLAGETHPAASRRTRWPWSQWWAGCFPVVGFAPRLRAEGSREGTQGRQIRSVGWFPTDTASTPSSLETPPLPAGDVGNCTEDCRIFGVEALLVFWKEAVIAWKLAVMLQESPVQRCTPSS